jgi:hypothetical protein
VFLVISLLQAQQGGTSPGPLSGILTSDVLTNVRSPAPCTSATPCPTIFNDFGQVSLTASLRDIGSSASPAEPTTNNAVTITRYRIRYRRADGRNVEGQDVPYGFDGAVTGTVSVGTTTALGFELVRHIAKEESPLVQLVSSRTIIACIAEVTFYGHDQVGNDVNVTGSILIEFGNFGDF